jgi:hypothetical protein
MSYHELYRVVDFEIISPYTLRIAFDDGSQQTVDLRPILYGEVFGPLRNLDFFNQVRLDAEAATLVWPNDAAFDPETLRHWPRYKDELAARAQRWETQPAPA